MQYFVPTCSFVNSMARISKIHTLLKSWFLDLLLGIEDSREKKNKLPRICKYQCAGTLELEWNGTLNTRFRHLGVATGWLRNKTLPFSGESAHDNKKMVEMTMLCMSRVFTSKTITSHTAQDIDDAIPWQNLFNPLSPAHCK